MPSNPDRRRELYLEQTKDKHPVRSLNAAINECIKALGQAQRNLQPKATHCLRGHLRTPENLRANGTCRICDRTVRAQKALENPKPPKTLCSNGHPWVPELPYCLLCRQATEARKSAKHKEEAKTRKLVRDAARAADWTNSSTGKPVSVHRMADLKKMGFTQKMLENTLLEQGNVCALCRQPFTPQDVACADHAHTNPPEPRGVLHRSCNSLVGFAKDSPELARLAADYLEAWSGM